MNDTPSTSRAGKPRTGPNLNALIARVLQVGMTSSVACLLAGGMLSAVSGKYGTSAAATHRLVSAAPDPISARAVVAGLLHLDGRALMTLGVFLLIATPLVRVVVSIGAFLAKRDRAYVLICSVVLALMILSFVLGMAG